MSTYLYFNDIEVLLTVLYDAKITVAQSLTVADAIATATYKIANVRAAFAIVRAAFAIVGAAFAIVGAAIAILQSLDRRCSKGYPIF